MGDVNKQLLEALAQLDLAETEIINTKAWSAGEQAKAHCDFALTAIATARQAIAAAEQAQQSEPVAFDVYCTEDGKLVRTIRATDIDLLNHYRKSPVAWEMVELYAHRPAVTVPDVTYVARAIWNIRREEEDRCDMELEDIPRDHSVWREAEAAMLAAEQKGGAA